MTDYLILTTNKNFDVLKFSGQYVDYCCSELSGRIGTNHGVIPLDHYVRQSIVVIQHTEYILGFYIQNTFIYNCISI